MAAIPTDGGPADSDPADTASEHRALAWTAAAAVVAIFWLVRPIGLGILLGTLLAFMAQPVFSRLAPRLGGRGAALATRRRAAHIKSAYGQALRV